MKIPVLAGLTAVCALSAAAQAIPGVLAAGAQPELVQEGFKFTEGPVGAADGSLYFDDVQNNRTHHLGKDGKITVVRENTQGANGIALDKAGDLFTAEGKRIAKRSPDGQVTTLTEGSGSLPLMAPNDLILDAKGGIYFTDPGPRPVVPGRKAYVYYLPAGSKEPRMLDDSIARPNGLTLTNNGKTLVVDDTIGDAVFAFDIQPDGSVKNKRPFAKLHGVVAGQESGADGLALDRQDRVWISTASGVQIFGKKGQYLGTVKVPRQPANVAFAGPGKKILYITAREGLYRLNTLSQGPGRLGK